MGALAGCVVVRLGIQVGAEGKLTCGFRVPVGVWDGILDVFRGPGESSCHDRCFW